MIKIARATLRSPDRRIQEPEAAATSLKFVEPVLDRIFTNNMTGNAVILGMRLMPGTGLLIVGRAIALISFMIGAALRWSRVN